MNKTRKWKNKLAVVLKKLREDSGIKTDDCPGKDFQIAIENQNNPKTPDISYLLRFLRIILKSRKSLPESFLLHRLIILFVLARIEALAFTDEEQLDRLEKDPNYQLKHKEDMQSGFKKKWMDDIDSRQRNEFDILNNFQIYWNGGEIKDDNETTKIENHGKIIENHFDEILGSIEKELESKINSTPSNENYAPTLANFPEAFNNLVVIVGDFYGEINRLPEYHFELFRKSASNTVLTYLLHLGLPKDALILSDHLIMRAKEEKRKELLANRNILVLGSPLVNVVSRFLTLRKSLIFNFVYEDEAYSGYENFYDNLENKLGNKSSVIGLFYKLMDKTKDEVERTKLKDIDEKIDQEELDKIKKAITELRALLNNDEARNEDVINLFNPTEIFSPLSPVFRSSSSDSETKHFALITIGENPWANHSDEIHLKRSLVAVCGLNRISTAGAVKVLLDKEGLTKHPLGGVILVKKPSDSRGLREIMESEPEWITNEYTPQDILEQVLSKRNTRVK